MTTDISPDTEYVFDSPSVQGRRQLDHLQVLFDPITTGVLNDIGVWPGHRCLDVGSGGGSIARWLADRVGRVGQVVATDLNIEQIDVPPQVEVYRHDIGAGLPTDGPFDLIHARFVLLHLSDREQILQTLIGALAPGGWLVLGETPDGPQEVLAAPTAADTELADRVIRTVLDVVTEAGAAPAWAYEVEQHFSAAGLAEIRGNEYSPMVTGGDAGALLMGTYVAQAKPLLLQAGLTEGELLRYHALMRDPRFRAWPFLRLVTTAGRKPVADRERTR